MKTIMLAIFLVLIHVVGYAQGAFEFTSSAYSIDVFTGGVEVNNEFVFVTSSGSEDVVFVRLDSMGMLLEQKKVSVLDSFVSVSGVYYLDSSLWVVGRGYDGITGPPFETTIWVGQFSTDFELISAQFWPLASKVYNIMERNYLVDSSIVLSGSLSNDIGSKEYFARYTPASNDFFLKTNNLFGSLVPDVLAKQDAAKGYVLYRAVSLQYVDTSFVLEKSLPSPQFGFVQGSILHHSDSTFVIFSEILTDDLRLFLFGQIDSNYNLMKSDTLYSAPKAGISGVWNLIAHKDALVESPDGNYYVGGNHHYAPSEVRPFLAKYDQDLNKLWSFRYSAPGQLYFMMGMMATSDNGCILYGHRNLDGHHKEAYVLKVNENGILTGETIIALKDEICCYPNPAKDYIQFDLPKRLERVNLELIDLSGRVVLAQKINHQASIDISFLPQGMYMYQVKGQNGALIGVGKVLKE